MSINIEVVDVEKDDELNVVIGQAHFIKTAEDIYEALVTAVKGISFGLAFCEASGKCLIRVEGNDDYLREVAIANAKKIAAGHIFFLAIKNAYPINVLKAIRDVPEVCRIFCATANQLQVLVATTAQGRGILGVVDGSSPLGVETDQDRTWRYDLLRKLGYKL
ncbi:MAG: adenosine-specific kinase [Candidatus Omnitrophica bacterium]|nr:adenosine-specific kinase [Candidatus Omnitrophota bacterium]